MTESRLQETLSTIQRSCEITQGQVILLPKIMQDTAELAARRVLAEHTRNCPALRGMTESKISDGRTQIQPQPIQQTGVFLNGPTKKTIASAILAAILAAAGVAITWIRS